MAKCSAEVIVVVCALVVVASLLGSGVAQVVIGFGNINACPFQPLLPLLLLLSGLCVALMLCLGIALGILVCMYGPSRCARHFVALLIGLLIVAHIGVNAAAHVVVREKLTVPGNGPEVCTKSGCIIRRVPNPVVSNDARHASYCNPQLIYMAAIVSIVGYFSSALLLIVLVFFVFGPRSNRSQNKRADCEKVIKSTEKPLMTA